MCESETEFGPSGSSLLKVLSKGNLVWPKISPGGVIGSVVIGAAVGRAAGNTSIGIAVCIALGVIAAGLWHLMRRGH
jgi:hypothetical protein